MNPHPVRRGAARPPAWPRVLFLVVAAASVALRPGPSSTPASAPASVPGTTKVRGRVVDERGESVDGARVVVLSRSRPESEAVASGPDGRFEIGVVEPKTGEFVTDPIVLRVTTAGGRIGWQPVLWGQRDGDPVPQIEEFFEPIRVAPGGGLVLDVRDPEGRPTDARIRVRLPGRLEMLAAGRAGPDGAATLFPLPIGEFDVSVTRSPLSEPSSREGGRARVRAKIVAGAAAPLRIDLAPTRSLDVSVVDADNGAPVVGAEVLVGERVTRGREFGEPWDGLGEPDVDLEASPVITGADGRVHIDGIPLGGDLVVNARAEGYVNTWNKPGGRCGNGPPDFLTLRRLLPDAKTLELAMKAVARTTKRWTIEGGSASVGPEGTPLELERVKYTANPWNEGRAPRREAPRARIVGDAVVVEGLEVNGAFTAWAVAPDGRIADLPVGDEGDGVARFLPPRRLEVVVRDTRGAVVPDCRVDVTRERPDFADAYTGDDAQWTDAQGVARFPRLLPERWRVQASEGTGAVDLERSDASVTLQYKVELVELRLELAVDGERRMPPPMYLSIADEYRRLRREDRANATIHVYVPRRSCDSNRRIFANLDAGLPGYPVIVLPLPEVLGPEPLTIALDFRRGGSLVVRFVGEPLPTNSFRLDRQDPASGRFTWSEGAPFLSPEDIGSDRRAVLGPLVPGVYRLVESNSEIASPSVNVTAGGEPATLDLDPSGRMRVEARVIVPPGESVEFVRLDYGQIFRPTWPDEPRYYGDWPIGEHRTGPDPRTLQFDRKTRPILRVSHPYLVPAPGSDAIDLADWYEHRRAAPDSPNAPLELRLMSGPVATFRAELPGGVEAGHGAFVTLIDRSDPAAPPQQRLALAQGALMKFKLPAPGTYRVAIDPVVAAPLELDAVEFRAQELGVPQDLGALHFARGSTLRVRAAGKAPFAAPRIFASAVRIDGARCERAARPGGAGEAATESILHALAPGRYRVTVRSTDGWAFPPVTAEATVDGEHDAEVTIAVDGS